MTVSQSRLVGRSRSARAFDNPRLQQGVIGLSEARHHVVSLDEGISAVEDVPEDD